ncbi:MAG: hypothetical protein U9R74_18045 [Pseudomonadota bacterium]|nr:hypothetical protein [Pseudomonadota bacterium]
MGTSPAQALDQEALELRLEEHVDAVLSSRRTGAGPAEGLAALDRDRQEFVLHWVSALAGSNAEMAFQFAAFAPEALRRMDREGIEAWAIQAMDSFDRQGLMSGVAALKRVEVFARVRQARLTGLSLDDVAGVLENFVHGLSGRRLKIEATDRAGTDTETLFLPGLLSLMPRREDNFRLYKSIAVHLWAQTRYGTWRIRPQDRVRAFPDPDRALRVYHALEVIRLDQRIAVELPGVHRDMCLLRKSLDPTRPEPAWEDVVDMLSPQDTGPEVSWSLVARLYDAEPPVCCYQGFLDGDAVTCVMDQRISRERRAFRVAMAKLGDELTDDPDQAAGEEPPEHEFTLAHGDDGPDGEPAAMELRFDDRPVEPPEEVRGLMNSIVLDFGGIPPEYLVPAGPGEYDAAAVSDDALDPNDVWKGTYHEEGAWLYNEWDHDRRHYRKNWCVLRERDVHPRHDEFVDATLRKYGGLVKSVRRTFEALRGEERLLRRQPDGEDIDLDALVTAYADLSSGMEMTDRVFTKLHRDNRSIAVMFMVDMSGSTKGWINDAERESLLLLCEALETLGDRYAIYGFSGMNRTRCELFRIKRFDEPYGELVRARISGIRPQDYTRMGVAIRHLTMRLGEVEARTKLLITLSDGKPDDYIGFRGKYGIEDTRQALFEARREGIHPFCITIDEQAGDYLPHMYGQVNYVVIDDVRKLPLKVSDIYRQLTA